jgi:uncharacterized membrane protein YbaN (DUF454 family)
MISAIVRQQAEEQESMIKKKLGNIAGFILLGLGLIGMILPIIPGIPLLIAGAALLGADHLAVRPFSRLLDRLKTGWRQRE